MDLSIVFHVLVFPFSNNTELTLVLSVYERANGINWIFNGMNKRSAFQAREKDREWKWKKNNTDNDRIEWCWKLFIQLKYLR